MITLLMLGALISAAPAHALDILGRERAERSPGVISGQGVRDGLVALYRFSPTRNGQALPANLIADESGVGTPLDLQISNTDAIQRRCERSVIDPVSGQPVPLCYLDFGGISAVVRSVTAATKITQQCRATNSITVEAWLRNDRADELTKEGRMMDLKIVTLGRNTPGQIGGRYAGSSNDNNFYLGLDYDMAAQYSASVRRGARTQRNAEPADGFTSANNNFNMQQAGMYSIETSRTSVNTPDTNTSRILVNDRLQHVIFTYRADGQMRLYVSAAAEEVNGSENPFVVTPVVRAETTIAANNPFSGWNEQFYLGLGNELTFNDNNAPVVRSGGNQTFRTENREWRGELYLLAIYCDAHSEEDILGPLAPNNAYRSYAPNPAVQITPTHLLAAKIYNRLTGVKIPVTAPIISGVNDPRYPDEDYAGRGMVQLIQQNNLLGAAQLAADQDSFYNITVRDFAKRMSTRDETVNTPLNDFVATIIGVARDNVPATQLLTGNFFYMGNPQSVAAPTNMQNDLLMSNNHYDRLEALGYNLRRVLQRVDGQKISNGVAPVDHPDPAGVLTSRAFLAAHADAGTNRRIIEYAFREFACVPIAAWADSTGPDNRIGKDVDRFPGGDNSKFLGTCRSCHSNMDGLRGAFARFHFNNSFVKHGSIITANAPSEDQETPTTMCRNANGVACKMNRNADVFPGGYETVDDSWVNNAYRGNNSALFGWTQEIRGNGARRFGEMLASSQAFPRCMAQRVFRAVCKRDPAAVDQELINQAAAQFVSDNYNLRNLFSRIVITPECLGSGE